MSPVTVFAVAAIQLRSSLRKEENLATAERLVGEAAGSGAAVVALPELFNCLGPHEDMARQAEPVPGETSERMRALAARHGIMLLAGSIAERVESGDGEKIFNTSLFYGPSGEELARYRKVHLFDVEVADGPSVEESELFSPGEDVCVASTPLGCFGLSICYDLRFASLYASLSERGAEMILIPSAFTDVTGKAHWEVLLRARAIENQAVVIAPNQCGEHAPGMKTHGHSMIVDAWGTVLGSATDEEEAVVMAEVSLEGIRDVRRQIPVLAHRRDVK